MPPAKKKTPPLRAPKRKANSADEVTRLALLVQKLDGELTQVNKEFRLTREALLKANNSLHSKCGAASEAKHRLVVAQLIRAIAAEAGVLTASRTERSYPTDAEIMAEFDASIDGILR